MALTHGVVTNRRRKADEIGFYTGPQKSRLLTGSWQAIETALDAGLLDESQWVELKKDLPPNLPRFRKPLPPPSTTPAKQPAMPPTN